MAISRQNSRSTSRRCDGAPDDFIGDRPVSSFIQPAGLPINTSMIKVLRRPIESAQYTSTIFAEYCAKNGIRRPLGRTGTCYDNAVLESFFATYKKELIHTRPWPSVKHLSKETFDWIEIYYNTQRRHSTLGYLTPQEYELGYREISQIAT